MRNILQKDIQNKLIQKKTVIIKDDQLNQNKQKSKNKTRNIENSKVMYLNRNI